MFGMNEGGNQDLQKSNENMVLQRTLDNSKQVLLNLSQKYTDLKKETDDLKKQLEDALCKKEYQNKKLALMTINNRFMAVQTAVQILGSSYKCDLGVFRTEQGKRDIAVCEDFIRTFCEEFCTPSKPTEQSMSLSIATFLAVQLKR
jgi:hypothetical protein